MNISDIHEDPVDLIMIRTLEPRKARNSRSPGTLLSGLANISEAYLIMKIYLASCSLKALCEAFRDVNG